MTDTFMTRINIGLLHNRQENATRQARWIEAKDIPLQCLSEYGNVRDNARHPHNIEGLAWDIDSGGWRNAKNARCHSVTLSYVTYDSTDPRRFVR